MWFDVAYVNRKHPKLNTDVYFLFGKWITHWSQQSKKVKHTNPRKHVKKNKIKITALVICMQEIKQCKISK